MIKTFWWTLGSVIFCFICALFLTDDLTQACSNDLIVCLTQKNSLPFWNKMGGGLMCVLNNVWCVLTSWI